MTFEEILDQATAMLQRRGRVSYRTLTLQFHLNEESLAALKEELIEVHHLAVDRDGRMLVWIGEARTTSAASSPQPPQEISPATPQAPDAERRQLTVLFCDLVDSTALARQLDVEDLRAVVRAYQAACAEVIQRFDGHIAQYLGDGLLVYFGYPQAHEDEVQRAVRCGLWDGRGHGDVEYAPGAGVRGAPGRAARHPHRAGSRRRDRQRRAAGATCPGGDAEDCGAAPGSGGPDTVVISEVTAHLIHGYFVCQSLGAQVLKGLPQPLQVYRVLQESGAQTRLDVATARGLTPLVGRDEEVALLQRRWDQTTAGMGQVVLLSGEAGIGKSRLVQVLKEHITAAPHTRIEWRGSPSYQQSALYPSSTISIACCAGTTRLRQPSNGAHWKLR